MSVCILRSVTLSTCKEKVFFEAVCALIQTIFKDKPGGYMEIISKFKEILNLQSENNRSISFDIVLKNGNLQIRAFQITSLDESSELIEGLTRLEIYSSLREKREPVYCKFHLGEIRDVICQELEYQEA